MIKLFIEYSPRTNAHLTNQQDKTNNNNKRGSTFHETMTFFWIHMVYYAMTMMSMESKDRESKTTRINFKEFLQSNPWLADGGLFLQYYSKELMLLDPLSRTQVMLPDIKPLPSIVPVDSSENSNLNQRKGVLTLPNLQETSDKAFYDLALVKKLPSWGHEVKLRLIYVMLLVHGRQKGGVDQILKLLESVENEGFHLTLNYFWVQMLTYQIMSVVSEKQKDDEFKPCWFGAMLSKGASASDDVVLDSTLSFSDFIKRRAESMQELLDNQLLYDQ
jgi:hypothetical protein